MIDRYKKLGVKYREIWWDLSTDIELNMDKYSDIIKRKKEKDFTKLIDNIVKYIESFPKDINKRRKWRDKGNIYLEKIIETEGVFKLGVIDKGMKNNFIAATKDFINEAKSFDKTICYEDIGQAMRNLWIVNMLQQAFGANIQFTNAIFGYSMLYPYTDNYLDNPEVDIEEKKQFNHRFTKRLNGELVNNVNEHEAMVYRLVEYIEKNFSRDKYPDVYKGLNLIHEGQILSLTQQDESSIPYEKDILGISIEKGGASVIADGYFIRGTMSEKEEFFTYGYGFLLQLCDDLQDIIIDKQNNHITIMSQIAGEYYLDPIINKLINLTLKVVNEAECFICHNGEELKTLIKNNCIYMILFAAVNNNQFFAKEYIDNIIEYLPFSLEYCLELNKLIKEKFGSLKKEYNGCNIEEILMYFIG